MDRAYLVNDDHSRSIYRRKERVNHVRIVYRFRLRYITLADTDSVDVVCGSIYIFYEVIQSILSRTVGQNPHKGYYSDVLLFFMFKGVIGDVDNIS